ncbi:hypothetical protein RFI_26021 [Reticulomyxa filosa]|uniref:Uncharacterized protein n=1 Tax=Reticulomyxa filosa TaxID=46433 RepID=X6MBG8_RETFI|nr:hypothetical protein RFI_26021 [Reticulomyxa filosa]|eukprot:ETO11353.1 hypothetical protein RFI_26021 [Reticulomyxa filosa]
MFVEQNFNSKIAEEIRKDRLRSTFQVSYGIPTRDNIPDKEYTEFCDKVVTVQHNQHLPYERNINFHEKQVHPLKILNNTGMDVLIVVFAYFSFKKTSTSARSVFFSSRTSTNNIGFSKCNLICAICSFPVFFFFFGYQLSTVKTQNQSRYKNAEQQLLQEGYSSPDAPIKKTRTQLLSERKRIASQQCRESLDQYHLHLAQCDSHAELQQKESEGRTSEMKVDPKTPKYTPRSDMLRKRKCEDSILLEKVHHEASKKNFKLSVFQQSVLEQYTVKELRDTIAQDEQQTCAAESSPCKLKRTFHDIIEERQNENKEWCHYWEKRANCFNPVCKNLFFFFHFLTNQKKNKKKLESNGKRILERVLL